MRQDLNKYCIISTPNAINYQSYVRLINYDQTLVSEFFSTDNIILKKNKVITLKKVMNTDIVGQDKLHLHKNFFRRCNDIVFMSFSHLSQVSPSIWKSHGGEES